MADRVHRGTVFGTEAAAYAAHRPGYAAAAIRWALAPLGPSARPRVLDVGAGTGKLTEGLVALPVQTVAVEPDPAMLAELTARLPQVEARIGTAERIPLPDASVDAVLVGTAMHWFDPNRAIPEFARVLRPGGVFAPLANVVDDRVDWVAGYAVAAGGLPSHRNNSARRRVRHPGFSRFELAEFPHTQRRTAAGLVATVATHSDTLMRPADQRAAKLDRLAAYLRGRPETEGEFDLPLVTLAQRARLEPAS